MDVNDRLVSLTREGFDLAIRHSQTLPETHIALKLCDTHAVLVASPAYLAQYGTPQKPDDLERHNCLYYLRGQEPPRWHFHKVTGGEETVMVKGQGNFATNNSESVRDAALQGLGIALLPDFSARAALAAGTLTQVLPAWRTVDAFAESLWVIRPHTAQVPKAVTTFIRWLRARFAE